MKLNITINHFSEIIGGSLSLDLVFLLKMIEAEYDVKELGKQSVKIDVLYQTLVRKGLISEDGKITITGNDLIKFIDSPLETKLVKHKKSASDFGKWWGVYPPNDTFEYRGKKFEGSRSLRQGKEDCIIKFNKILLEGEYTTDTLIKALEIEISQKKENSYSTGTNKLSYMQNSLTYLRQRTFESFIPLIKEFKEPSQSTENTFNGTEI